MSIEAPRVFSLRRTPPSYATSLITGFSTPSRCNGSLILVLSPNVPSQHYGHEMLSYGNIFQAILPHSLGKTLMSKLSIAFPLFLPNANRAQLGGNGNMLNTAPVDRDLFSTENWRIKPGQLLIFGAPGRPVREERETGKVDLVFLPMDDAVCKIPCTQGVL